MRNYKRIATISVALALLGLNACSDNDNNDNPGSSIIEQTYSITVSNLTNAQPLTPIGVIIHTAGFDAWEAGDPLSTGLEMLAESGNPAEFLSESTTNNAVITTASGSAPFGPGSQQSVSITIERTEDLKITLATMLANTNDAFTGVTNWDISALEINESKSIMPHVYDAGTEANTETAATMPGPAAGGEGFDADRSADINKVTIHPGVVTTGDGLLTSALDESHRWLGAAAKIVITRTQ